MHTLASLTTPAMVEAYKSHAVILAMLEGVPVGFDIEAASMDTDFHYIATMTFIMGGGDPIPGSSPLDAVEALRQLVNER